ncbi:hypothetical protein BD289DRAFT_158312 [Coniella lustricola]|uniref:Ubiquitin 3 binding protein But2 C-terminal domain-domain-containing protein n=1 Tax=Coniella lustricola TaxID=2025994 RepID=A0A2T3AMS6_9PEZI|nr:hypothetical protein BD289DRAFT_158312 [Coniella lustricola]
MHCNPHLLILSLLAGPALAAPAPAEWLQTHGATAISRLVSPRNATKTVVEMAAPTHVAPASCKTYYPSVLRQLLEANPDVMQDNTASSFRSFHVAQSVSHADGIKYNRIQQYVLFDSIAPGSWDCQLMVSWPDAGLVGASAGPGSTSTSSISLDVYSASYNANAFDSLTQLQGAKIGTPDSGPFATWTSMMGALKIGGGQSSADNDGSSASTAPVSPVNAKLTYFSTVAVNPGEYGITVNSEACPSSGNDTLGFIFEVPVTDSRNASVSFLGDAEAGDGVYLLANC